MIKIYERGDYPVEKKKTKSKLSALLPFLLGIVLMLVVYILFEFAPNRFRAGAADETKDTTTGIVKTANIVQTVTTEEAPVSPSAFLGVEVLSVNTVIAEQLSLPSDCGVLINGVVDGSPAQKSGLQRGDCLVSLDGKPVEDIDGFRGLIAKYKPGDNVRIAYIRNALKDTVYAQLAELPEALAAQSIDSSDVDWGVSLSDISSAMRNSLDIPTGIDGVAILSVKPGGAADAAGLLPGDVITGIDKGAISDMDDFFSALSSNNDNIALLDVYRQGSVRYVPLDSSGIVEAADRTQTQTTLRQKIFSIFTGGMPFTDDDDEDEEGPKGGKFARDDVQLTADNTAFNRPSTVPGDENTGGSGTTGTTGMNRPTSVPSQSSGPTNDTVLFIGLLILLILYLSYREYTRPAEVQKS
jgi:hypothetical protein